MGDAYRRKHENLTRKFLIGGPLTIKVDVFSHTGRGLNVMVSIYRRK